MTSAVIAIICKQRSMAVSGDGRRDVRHPMWKILVTPLNVEIDLIPHAELIPTKFFVQ